MSNLALGVNSDGGTDWGLVRFGAYEFDRRTGELRKKGIRLKLDGQPVLVLAMLLERAGELVTREELQEELWPGHTFVDFEQGLNAAVKRLRATLNDSAATPRYIETLPRRGYRFIAPVHNHSNVGSARTLAQARENDAAPSSVVGILPSAAIRSVAVLPLNDLSGETSQEYFADGLTEALITDLAQIGALRVISRTSVMRYKNTQKTLAVIIQELGVDGVIEGSVVRSGNRVRITSQLIHGVSERHLWARSYERDLSDIVALQGEIAQAIADEIRVTVTPELRSRLAAPKPVDRRAYELYLRGQFHFNQWSPEGMKRAIDCLQEAVVIDPIFGPAYAALAYAYNMSTLIDATKLAKEYFPLAKNAAMRALALDPFLADAHTALGVEKSFYEFDRAGAEADLLRGIELNPNSAQAHRYYANAYLRCMGRNAEAIGAVKKALELDPLSVHISANLAVAYMYSGMYDTSLEQFQRALELDPNRGRVRLVLAVFLAELSRFRESAAEFERGEILLGIAPRDASKHANALRQAYASAGPAGFWRQYLNWGLEVIGQPGQFWFDCSDIAEAYAQLGKHDEAFEWLEKSYGNREGISLSALHVEPGFKSLHGDPRFTDLLRRLNLRQ